MALINSISELTQTQIKETWYNCRQIYADLYDFFKTSLLSVLDDNGFELTKKHLPPWSFIDNLDMSIACAPMNSLMKSDLWERISGGLYLGVFIDEEKGNQMSFYTWLNFTEEFHQNFFHKSAKASKLRQTLESKGWNFEFDGDAWILNIFKSADDIKFSSPTWKKELKKFYEGAIADLSETVIKTKDWLE